MSRELTAGSASHDLLWANIKRRGKLTLHTRLDLHHFLRPAVQPGSTLDYTWPPESVTVVFESSSAVIVKTVGDVLEAKSTVNDGTEVSLTCSGDAQELIDVTIELSTDGATIPELTAAVFTNEDARPRPLPLRRLFLPWVRSKQSETSDEELPDRLVELEGGNWGRGRQVFHSQAAACFKCHAVGSVGATIGPDLTNLIHRDYASVTRDILNPSFAINPDYIGHTVLLADGQVLTGVLQTEEGQLLLGDAQGKVTRLDRSSIESMQPASVSVMPKGLQEKLTEDQFRDLMTFLLTPPPQMPLDAPLEAPPVRTRGELAAVLAGSATLARCMATTEHSARGG